MYAGLVGDERVAFGHVADARANLSDFGPDVAPEDSRRARRRPVKSEQRVNQRRLASAVRAGQADAPAPQRALDVVQDAPLAEIDSQVVEFNDWIHRWVSTLYFVTAFAAVALCFSAFARETFPLTPLIDICGPPVPMRAL